MLLDKYELDIVLQKRNSPNTFVTHSIVSTEELIKISAIYCKKQNTSFKYFASNDATSRKSNEKKNFSYEGKK